jgi:acyl carrier protein
MLDYPAACQISRYPLYHRTGCQQSHQEGSVDGEDIEDIILGFLADDDGCSVEQLRKELLGGGQDLPLDSLLAVEVLARVQHATGVKLPATAETAFALRSVRGFALAVLGQLGHDEVGSQPA